MSFHDLIRWAQNLIRANATSYVPSDLLSLARAILELLGNDQPCGYPDPLIKHGDVKLVDVDGHYTPADLRAMCAVWLRAADEAERIP